MEWDTVKFQSVVLTVLGYKQYSSEKDGWDGPSCHTYLSQHQMMIRGNKSLGPMMGHDDLETNQITDN